MNILTKQPAMRPNNNNSPTIGKPPKRQNAMGPNNKRWENAIN